MAKTSRTPKAYKNLEFLNSPQARSLRILAEFLEPLSRFKKEGIKDTIVFFGSARILPFKEANKRLEAIKAQIFKSKKPSKVLQQKLEDAIIDRQMSGYYEDAATLTYKLTKWSKGLNNSPHFVICSGGGPGIMEAANKGALKAGGKSMGLNISLPFEQDSNPYISKNLSFEFHYFFMRKFWFLYPAKALVIFPGGFGSLDEFMEVLTLVQTKKIKKSLTIVLYGRNYWNQVINFPAMVKYRTISKGDLNLFSYADTPDEAFAILKKGLTKNYLSSPVSTFLKQGS
jgi:uncharacterized protein (TIGR00730 family)